MKIVRQRYGATRRKSEPIEAFPQWILVTPIEATAPDDPPIEVETSAGTILVHGGEVLPWDGTCLRIDTCSGRACWLIMGVAQ